MTRHGRRAKVLVVDDSALQREVLKQALDAEGYDVVTADSGLTGIACAYTERPHVIVSDVVMPEINGYHLCRFVKTDSLLQSTPVVLLTSTALHKRDRFWGMRSGADAYISKSGDLSSLLQTITSLVGEGRLDGQPVDAGNAGTAPARLPRNIKAYLSYLFDKLLFEMTIVNEIRRLGEYVHDRERLFGELAALVDSLMEYAVLGVAVLGSDKGHVQIRLQERIGQETLNEIRRGLARESGMPGLVSGDVDVVLTPPALYEPGHTEPDGRPCVTAPLQVRDLALGSVCVVPRRGATVDVGMSENLALLARELAPIIRTFVYYQEAKRLSVSDALTGLHNYRFFAQAVDLEIRRFKRYGHPFSVIMMDLDGFKSVNDVHGHLAGDAVLRGVGELLRASLRDVDVAARYGGDEFGLLLPETSLECALMVGERVRQALKERTFPSGEEALSITGSFGAAEVTAEYGDASALIGAADKALYSAKQAGRNCVRSLRLRGAA